MLTFHTTDSTFYKIVIIFDKIKIYISFLFQTKHIIFLQIPFWELLGKNVYRHKKKEVCLSHDWALWFQLNSDDREGGFPLFM